MLLRILAGAVCIGALLSVYSFQQIYSISLVSRHQFRTPEYRNVVFRSGGLTFEGIGSSFQHFKHSVILADLLGYDLVTAELQSEHHYSLNQAFNGNISINGGSTFATPICDLKYKIDKDELHRLLVASCENDERRVGVIKILQHVLKGCGSIQHYVEDYELNENLNGCTKPWVQRTLLKPLCGRAQGDLLTGEHLNIGIHLRWGDVAQEDLSQTDTGRAITFQHANQIVQSIKSCNLPLKVQVAAENITASADAHFDFDHDLINTGSDIGDLCELSRSDVLINGGSSFAAFAYQLSNARFSIVEDNGYAHGKYNETQTPTYEAVTVSDWLRRTDTCHALREHLDLRRTSKR